MLNSDEIIVGIPRRGFMFVCPNNADKKLKNNFINFHYSIWKGFKTDNQPIVQDLFILKNGVIQSVLFINN